MRTEVSVIASLMELIGVINTRTHITVTLLHLPIADLLIRYFNAVISEKFV